MTIARITTKERVAKLEEEISCINRRLEELIRLFGTKDIPITSIKPNMPTVSVLNKVSPGIEPVFDLNPRTALFKKPIMYLYNMTGVTTQVTVDFGSIVIPDAIPEIRADGKISFKLDADSYIDNKYKYLYYEIEYDKPLPKPVLSIVISNDKFLSEGLANLARLCGLWSDEISDFVTYWDLELKRSDAKFWKCDIFTEKELDPILPISIFPKPEFFIRRYIKFTESDKGQKTSSKTSRDVRLITPMRTGSLRVCEWGGMIADSGTFL